MSNLRNEVHGILCRKPVDGNAVKILQRVRPILSIKELTEEYLDTVKWEGLISACPVCGGRGYEGGYCFQCESYIPHGAGAKKPKNETTKNMHAIEPSKSKTETKPTPPTIDQIIRDLRVYTDEPRRRGEVFDGWWIESALYGWIITSIGMPIKSTVAVDDRDLFFDTYAEAKAFLRGFVNGADMALRPPLD